MKIKITTPQKIEKDGSYDAEAFDVMDQKDKIRLEVITHKSREVFGLTYDPKLEPGTKLADDVEKLMGGEFRVTPGDEEFDLSQLKGKKCKLVLQRRRRGENNYSLIPTLILPA